MKYTLGCCTGHVNKMAFDYVLAEQNENISFVASSAARFLSWIQPNIGFLCQQRMLCAAVLSSHLSSEFSQYCRSGFCVG